MIVTFILITFLPSPCCQLIFSFQQHTAHHHTVTMSLPSVLLRLLVCFNIVCSSFSPHPDSAKKSGCFKVSSCKCIMKDGSGVINLKAMGDAEGFLGRLEHLPAETMARGVETLVSFSPCLPFSQPEDLPGGNCSNVAACVAVR